ncbi:MAG: GntR family transcriptional regulator [Geminicoccaceae bacterium]|nr:GntR family transcriptional regulator [Geminicoccaceae bacterium]
MGNALKLQPITDSFSLKDHIYEVLKDGITAMNIYADDADLRLDERRLAEQMNISRTPIREALARLEQEGLVSILPRRGVFITRKSVAEILEMIVAWAALESMAARLATERAAKADLASLRALAASFSSDWVVGHIDEYSQHNIAFHQRILELSGCGLLVGMAGGLFVHMRAIRARTMGEDDRARRSIVDHMHIIEALEARDGDLASRLVREHTMNLHAHVERHWVEPNRERRRA